MRIEHVFTVIPDVVGIFVTDTFILAENGAESTTSWDLDICNHFHVKVEVVGHAFVSAFYKLKYRELKKKLKLLQCLHYIHKSPVKLKLNLNKSAHLPYTFTAHAYDRLAGYKLES